MWLQSERIVMFENNVSITKVTQAKVVNPRDL